MQYGLGILAFYLKHIPNILRSLLECEESLEPGCVGKQRNQTSLGHLSDVRALMGIRT